MVHFMRNVLAKVSKGHDEMVAATIRTIFAQPGQTEVRAQVDRVAGMLAGQFPAVADMLLDAKADLTAFADFPLPHWRKIWSTNPLERLNREVKRRTDVVGIFPNPGPAETVELRAHRGPRRVARQRPPLPVRGVHGPAHAAHPDHPGTQNHDPGHDLAKGDRRYGIVTLTRRATHDELHHPAGHGPRELLGRMDSSGMLSERGGRVSWAAPDLNLVAEGQRWEGRGVKQELQIARERARWAKHLAPSPIPRSGPGWPAKRRRRQPVRTPRIRATPEPDVAGRGSLPHTPKIKYGYGGGRRVGQSIPNAQGAAPGQPVGRRSRRLPPRTP